MLFIGTHSVTFTRDSTIRAFTQAENYHIWLLVWAAGGDYDQITHTCRAGARACSTAAGQHGRHITPAQKFVYADNHQVRSWAAPGSHTGIQIAKFDPGLPLAHTQAYKSPSSILVHLGCPWLTFCMRTNFCNLCRRWVGGVRMS